MDCFFMSMEPDANAGIPKLIKPIPSDQGALIRDAGSVKLENLLYKEAIGDTITHIHETSTHYLGKAASLDGDSFSDYMVATLAQAKPRRNILQSISDAKRDKTGHNVAFFIPPRASDTADGSANDNRFAENIMGEETEHLTKLEAKTNIHLHLDDHTSVLRFLGNCWIIPQIIYDVTHIEPIWSTCIQELGHALTDPSVRKWFDLTCSKPDGHHIPYSVLNIVEQLHVQLATSQKERTVLACSNDDLDAVDQNIYVAALNLTRQFIAKIISASKGGDRIAECTLWLTSAKKKSADSVALLRETDRMRRLAAQTKGPPTPPH